MAGNNKMEFRDAGDSWRLSGYATVWDRPYRVYDRGDSYMETVRAGAFDSQLRTRPEPIIPLLYSHNPDSPVLAATGPSKSMRLYDDGVGLAADISLAKNDPDCQAMWAKIDSKRLDSFSIGYYDNKPTFSQDRSRRDVTDARLGELSVVLRPANPAARVSSRGGMELRYAPSGIAVGRQGDDDEDDGMVTCKTCSGTGTLPDGLQCGLCKGTGVLPDDQDQDDGSDGRASRPAHEIAKLGAQGKAFKNPDGHWSFPIETAADLQNAVAAINRAPAGVRDAVKRYILRRAREMNLQHLVPNSWTARSVLLPNDDSTQTRFWRMQLRQSRQIGRLAREQRDALEPDRVEEVYSRPYGSFDFRRRHPR